MKKIFTAYLLLFCLVDFAALAQDPFQDERSLWLEKAQMSIPKLTETVKSPKGVVTVGKDASAYQGWKVMSMNSVDSLYTWLVQKEVRDRT